MVGFPLSSFFTCPAPPAGLPRGAKSFPSPASCSAQNSLPNKPAPPSSSRRRLPPYSRPLLPPQTNPTHNISWIFRSPTQGFLPPSLTMPSPSHLLLRLFLLCLLPMDSLSEDVPAPTCFTLGLYDGWGDGWGSSVELSTVVSSIAFLVGRFYYSRPPPLTLFFSPALRLSA